MPSHAAPSPSPSPPTASTSTPTTMASPHSAQLSALRAERAALLTTFASLLSSTTSTTSAVPSPPPSSTSASPPDPALLLPRARALVRAHIARLHAYNAARDAAHGLAGLVAEGRGGVRVGGVLAEFGAGESAGE